MADPLPLTPESSAGPTTSSAAPSAARLASTRISAAQLRELADLVVSADGSGETLAVEQPFTGAPLGEVPRSSDADIGVAFERARSAQSEWAQSSFGQRRRVLLRFHDLLLSRRDELLDLIQLETGKARRHAIEEVLDVATVARYYANTA